MFKVRAVRIARNIKQGQLAHLAGLPQSTLSGIETGRLRPTADELRQISKALGIPPEELMEPASLMVANRA